MNTFGWIDNQDEVNKVKATLRYVDCDQLIGDSNLKNRVGSEPVQLYKIFKQIVGKQAPYGPQKIGDCVSWGWGTATNMVQAIQIWTQLNKLNIVHLVSDGNLLPEAQDHSYYQEAKAILYRYEDACTEWIYGSSRVEIGGQRGSREDGSVGAWAAKSTAKLGVLSRQYLVKKGLKGDYDPQRAKDWGANGVPDNLEADGAKHVFTDVVPCTSYSQAVTMLRSYRPVPVCSNQGFTEQRDSSGGCKPSGTWAHCMCFTGEDDKGRLCCHQSWGDMSPTGPLYFDQPSNSFWVDPDTADRMLKANDSYAPAGYLGYEVEDFLSWHH